MDCNRVHHSIDSGSLDNPAPEVLEHLASCRACDEAWRRARVVLETLRGLPEPPVPAGYAERVLGFTQAAVYYQHRQRRAAWAWGLGLAAALLLGLGIGLGMEGTPDAGKIDSGYQVHDGIVMVPVGSVTEVHLALDAGRPIHGVGFVINIPAGMELQGHPGEHRVAWTGELVQGRNILNLPLVVTSGAAGTLEADLHFAGRENTLKVQVQAVEDSALQGLVRRLLARIGLG